MSNILKDKLLSKEFWKSRNGQITFCVVGGLFSVIFFLSQTGIISGSLFPSTAGREKLEKELKKHQQSQKDLEAELAGQEELRKLAMTKFNGAWRADVNGVPEVELRSKLENTARDMDLRFNQLSTVRRVNFNSDLELLEIDMDLIADIDLLTKFLLAVDGIEPKLYWKRFECRMINYYGIPAVRFSGSLRCVNDKRSEADVKKASAGQKDSGGSK